MRTLSAFLFVPALLPAAILGYLYVAAGPVPSVSPELVLGTILPLSYVTTYLIGLPAYALLRLLRATTLSSHLVWGLLISVIAQFVYLDSLVANWRLWWASVGGLATLAPIHTLGGQAIWWVYGTAMGGLFWLVSRPDLQNPSARMTRPLYDGIHRSAP
jgi:hypothetical protein